MKKENLKLNRKERRNFMIVLVGLVLLFIGILIVWAIPKSPIKSQFQNNSRNAILENKRKYGFLAHEVYTEDDIKDIPYPIQQFYRTTKLIGKEKQYIVHVEYKNTDFKMGKDKPAMKIKYQHYNMLDQLNRIALIDTKFMGIPFEGLDNYQNGIGSMKGMLGKVITLFDSKGEEMNISSLVTCLSEMVFLPTIALQDYIVWEPIDSNNAKALLNYNGFSVSATFTTNNIGEIIQIETNDRYMDEGDGKSTNYKWVIKLSDYIEENGIRHPSKAQAIWKLPKGEYLYFDGKGITINYNM